MNITDPIYADEDKAREHLESRFSTGCHGDLGDVRREASVRPSGLRYWPRRTRSTELRAWQVV